MAIYHFSAKIISRSTGRSAVAAAAYRSASRLDDDRLGRTHDFTGKTGVIHSEVMLPEGAPQHLTDRQALWNEVEALERRKDAQLAREIEFAIPREMTGKQAVSLARDFVSAEFVSRGMVADLNVHWDIGADGEAKPHAHVMLTLREVGAQGFGAKQRDWNATALLEHWRGAWAEHVNERCRVLGLEARIDHRSNEALGISLEPQDKIGPAGSRRQARGEPAERARDHRSIARNNGAVILGDPAIGLDALTRNRATFTIRDLAKFAHRHSDGQQQFDAVFAAMRYHPALLELGRDGKGVVRFTTRSVLSSEEALVRSADQLSVQAHRMPRADVLRAEQGARTRGLVLSSEQRQALTHVTGSTGLSLLIGYAGSGKSALLGAAREAWQMAGYNVRGAALSGIAAQNLEEGSGIASRTIASLELGWAKNLDKLQRHDVLVIDEAAMVGTRQLQRLLGQASSAGAKVVLIGDVQQLQSIEAGAAFRLLSERHGAAEIRDVRRQKLQWMRDATRAMATGEMGDALIAYKDAGMVHAAASRDQARADLIARWDDDRRSHPNASRIILTHLKKEVAMLNDAARQALKDGGELGAEAAVRTEKGIRNFAPNDRVIFLRNERSLGVKNGTLGTVEKASSTELKVRLDDGRHIRVDLKSYAHVDHGYATTIHKAQGMTVDETHVLATPGLDAHGAYVALSRHRLRIALHHGRDDFRHDSELRETLSRERPKDMALDYQAPARNLAREKATDQDRSARLRAMVAARVNEARKGLGTVARAIGQAAERQRSAGKSRDHGAEL